jgi:drug/metabolite transporter (DMT)-like permease
MYLFYALFAALLWGFDYAFAERVLRNISIPVFLAIQLFFASVAIGLIALIKGYWQQDLASLLASKSTIFLFGLGIIAFTIANILICSAIQSKNATLSSLIEISYPFFIALISWFFFKENQLTPSIAIGGTLIFIGSFIIYYFSH